MSRCRSGRWMGRITLRADQPDLTLKHDGGPHSVVIVENLQAAETLADRFDDLIVIYTAGLPSGDALNLIRQLRTRPTGC